MGKRHSQLSILMLMVAVCAALLFCATCQRTRGKAPDSTAGTGHPPVPTAGPLRQPPYVTPLRVELAFERGAYAPPSSLAFSLLVRNESARPLTVGELEPQESIEEDVRTMAGEPVDIFAGIVSEPVVSITDYHKLRPGRAIGATVKWRDEWRLPSQQPGRYRVRFLYDTSSYVFAARNQTISVPPYRSGSGAVPKWSVTPWSGAVLSNTVVVEFGRDEVRVLGDWHRLSPEVECPTLLRKYRLTKSIGHEKRGPAEAGLSLSVVGRGIRRTVTRLEDLSGFVSVRSRADALSFVRLATSVNTHYLFHGRYVIEAKRSDSHADELFGSVWPYWFTPDGKRKLQPPRVVREGNVFVVSRDLVTYPDPRTRKSRIYRAVERVSADGHYEHRVGQVLFEGDLWKDPYYVYLPYY